MTEGASGGAEFHEPASPEELAALLRTASEKGRVVSVVGGGTRQGYGDPLSPDLIVSMERFSGVEAWDPDDLTMTMGAGTPVGYVESTLAERSQTAVLPEVPGDSTVGGAISAGASSLRRARLLGTRERMLEVTLVTGDGRIVRGGGRVVKNVSGYDLPRLVVGSFGSLGVIVSVCLKLWPVPPAAATVELEDRESADKVVRPLAVLEEADGVRVFLWGTPEEVETSAIKLGGSAGPGLNWPADPEGPYRWSLRVPPARTAEAITRLPDGWSFVAIHGAGEIRVASEAAEGAADLRGWAESEGGALVVVAAPRRDEEFDPWGRPPPALDLQRKLIAQFDPARIINPGRLPGGL